MTRYVALPKVLAVSKTDDQIVDWMTPIANYLKDLPAGWTIPIGM
jgi:hypothetical protein